MIHIKNFAGSDIGVPCRKVVIKLGSAVVIGPEQAVDVEVLESLADSIARLREKKVEVIVVTSGSISVGCRLLGRPRPKNLPEKQALAAIGQIGLMHTYQSVLASRGLQCAQLLLTRGDMDDRRRYLNARYALERILAFGAIPIINENDTVATDEISFGDNDGLSAYVAVKMKADLLLLLSSVDGLHAEVSRSGRPKGDPIAVVSEIGDEIEGYAQGGLGLDGAGHGTGGMQSKLDAARSATQAGVHTVIANGKAPGIVDQIAEGDFRGTFFPARGDGSISARARWIGYGRASGGKRLVLDGGASEAIEKKKKSLLPVGVVGVKGKFKSGDAVEICDPKGKVVARGLVNYSSEDIEKIKGCRTSEIKSILGHRDYDEIVHRDNLVIL